MREAAWFIAGQSRSAPVGAAASLIRAAAALMKRWRFRAKLARLEDMDDHLLSDIGLTRDDIRSLRALPWTDDPNLDLQRRALRNRHRGWRA